MVRHKHLENVNQKFGQVGVHVSQGRVKHHYQSLGIGKETVQSVVAVEVWVRLHPQVYVLSAFVSFQRNLVFFSKDLLTLH